MGIPKYAGYVIDRFNSAKVQIKTCNTLSLDLNAILHQILAELYEIPHYLELNQKKQLELLISRIPVEVMLDSIALKTINFVEELVQHYKVTDALIIAVDGKPPLAKVKQQAERRYQARLGQQDNGIMKDVDRNVLTFRSEIMKIIHLQINTLLMQRKNNGKYPPKIIYSSHLIKGEGEQKIFDILRSSQIDINSGIHLIYGVDADFFLLSIGSGLHNLYLSRNDLHEAYSIDNLKTKIVEVYSTTTPYDFVLLSILLGNDFLPKFKIGDDLGSFYNILFETYKEFRKNNDAIIKENSSRRGDDKLIFSAQRFQTFIEMIADKEPELLIEQIENPSTHMSFLKYFENKKKENIDEELEDMQRDYYKIASLNFSCYNDDGSVRDMKNFSDEENLFYTIESYYKFILPLDVKEEEIEQFVDNDVLDRIDFYRKIDGKKINDVIDNCTTFLADNYTKLKAKFGSDLNQIINREDGEYIISDQIDDDKIVEFVKYCIISMLGDDLATMVSNQYLFGVFWTFKYFTMGSDSIDKNWVYPFFTAPLFMSLANLRSETIRVHSEMLYDKKEDIPEYFYSSIQVLFLIIPPKSVGVVKETIQDWINKNRISITNCPKYRDSINPGHHINRVILPMFSQKRMMKFYEPFHKENEKLANIYEKEDKIIILQAPSTSIARKTIGKTDTGTSISNIPRQATSYRNVKP